MAQDMDQFFTEEDVPAPGTPAAPRAQAPAPARGGIKPPTFGMAAAAAAVALLLGVAIGYVAGMYVGANAGGRAGEVAGTATVATTTDAAGSSTDGELPSGHPDLSQFMNADGTVNEEALAAYKEQRASEQEKSE